MSAFNTAEQKLSGKVKKLVIGISPFPTMFSTLGCQDKFIVFSNI